MPSKDPPDEDDSAAGGSPPGRSALLLAALDELISELCDVYRIDCRVEVEEGLDVSDEQVADSLYRIAREAVANAALHAGSRGYVEKQEPTEEIMAAVREVLAGRRYVSSRIARRLEQAKLGRREAGDDTALSRLSDRELEVFTLIGRGLGTREIAERLGLSVKTVETYREHLKEKLALGSGAELTRRAVAWVLAQE